MLADLVAGTAYRVLLPLAIEEGRPAYVTVEGLRGVAVYDAGGESFSVVPGERRRVDPSRSDLRSDASPLPEGGTRVRVRARPYTAHAEPPPIDPEVEKMLNSLGYVSR